MEKPLGWFGLYSPVARLHRPVSGHRDRHTGRDHGRLYLCHDALYQPGLCGTLDRQAAFREVEGILCLLLFLALCNGYHPYRTPVADSVDRLAPPNPYPLHRHGGHVAGPLGFGPAIQEGLRALYRIQEINWFSNSFSVGYCCDP